MSLFEPFEPYAVHALDVGDGHALYVEESGNPAGIPVIRLHGGPGSGCKPKHRQMFDPARYRVVLFDQRGCGKSVAEDILRANTTEHLLRDIEKIREFLGIEVWGAVVGYSWGSTLGLAYAEAYPDRVGSLAVGAVFLGTEKELMWFYSPDGLARFFPEAYAEVVRVLVCEPAAMPGRLLEILQGPDPVLARQAAVAVMRLDMLSCEPNPDGAAIEALLADDTLPFVEKSLVWGQYFSARCYLAPGQLLGALVKLEGMPVSIVHGALDMCCPPEVAVALHHALPEAAFAMIAGCGHLATPEAEAVRMLFLEQGVRRAVAQGRCKG